jgi:hypothetical protein
MVDNALFCKLPTTPFLAKLGAAEPYRHTWGKSTNWVIIVYTSPRHPRSEGSSKIRSQESTPQPLRSLGLDTKQIKFSEAVNGHCFSRDQKSVYGAVLSEGSHPEFL